MQTAHLISGLPCSGKTSYAKALRETTNAVLFSLDYWLITMHGRYSIQGVGYDEHVRRVLACRHLISDVACEFLQRGADLILDDGFFLREHRMQQIAAFRRLSTREGLSVQVITHIVQAPVQTLYARLAKRNADLPPYNFTLGFEHMEQFSSIYEPPVIDEGAGLVFVDGTARTARNANHPAADL
jgi:predicted kinase